MDRRTTDTEIKTFVRQFEPTFDPEEPFVIGSLKPRTLDKIETHFLICLPDKVLAKSYSWHGFASYIDDRRSKPAANLRLAQHKSQDLSHAQLWLGLIPSVVILSAFAYAVFSDRTDWWIPLAVLVILMSQFQRIILWIGPTRHYRKLASAIQSTQRDTS